MRKNVLFMSVSLIITALFIGLAVMPVTSGGAFSLASTEPEPVIKETKKETSDTTGTGELAMPAGTLPPTNPCLNCAEAVFYSIIETMPTREEAIKEFIDIIKSMPDMNLVQFNRAILNWTIIYKTKIREEMTEYLEENGFELNVAEAVDKAIDVLKDIAEDLYEELQNNDDPLWFEAILTIVTLGEMAAIFIIVSSGALLLQCLGGLLDEIQSEPAPAPGSTGVTATPGTTEIQIIQSGSVSI